MSQLSDLIEENDALAQRCRELEAETGRYRDIAYARVDECAALRAEVADLKARLLEAERGNEELVRLRAEQRNLRAFVDWVRNAPVSSGVCCCGDDMDRHGDPMACGHSPVDEWDYTLADWLVSLDLVEPKP